MRLDTDYALRQTPARCMRLDRHLRLPRVQDLMDRIGRLKHLASQDGKEEMWISTLGNVDINSTQVSGSCLLAASLSFEIRYSSYSAVATDYEESEPTITMFSVDFMSATISVAFPHLHRSLARLSLS